MNLEMILTTIDSEIALLVQARALLGGEAVRQPTRGKVTITQRRKHQLTPEGRKRIAEAVKRRWAKQKKAAA